MGGRNNRAIKREKKIAKNCYLFCCSNKYIFSKANEKIKKLAKSVIRTFCDKEEQTFGQCFV